MATLFPDVFNDIGVDTNFFNEALVGYNCEGTESKVVETLSKNYVENCVNL